MYDKVFVKTDKKNLWDKHPHWMIAIVSFTYIICIIILALIKDLSIIPMLFVIFLGLLISIYYIIKKLSWDKASGLIGFVKKNNVLYAIRLYGDYSEAGVYISVPPSMTLHTIASIPNNIDYAKKSLAIEKKLDSLSKDKNIYIIILESLLYDLKKNKNNFFENVTDYKIDMFINKYGFKIYFPDLATDFYCGYIIMNNPKIVKSNNKWFEISFIDEENNSKTMRFKNVYNGLLDELKNK